MIYFQAVHQTLTQFRLGMKFVLFGFVMLLASCANTNSDSSTAYQDTSTPPSDARNRAGLRLELASAYYEQIGRASCRERVSSPV